MATVDAVDRAAVAECKVHAVACKLDAMLEEMECWAGDLRGVKMLVVEADMQALRTAVANIINAVQ